MSYNVIDLRCPSCAGDITPDQQFCSWCRRALVISSFSAINSMSNSSLTEYMDSCAREVDKDPKDKVGLQSSLAMSYLKFGDYERAYELFDKAMSSRIENSDTYFCAAVAVLEGKRPFVLPRKVIDKALTHLDTAIKCEPKGIYYFVSAFVMYDAFKLHYLNPPAKYDSYLAKAKGRVTQADLDLAFEMLGCEAPRELLIRI